MPPENPDAAFLWSMWTAAREAAMVAQELTLDRLRQDRIAQLAAAKALEEIGEAASRVSQVFQDRHPEIPWEEIIGMRHRLVHHYQRTRFEVVWRTLVESVPTLLAQLEPLVPTAPSDE